MNTLGKALPTHQHRQSQGQAGNSHRNELKRFGLKTDRSDKASFKNTTPQMAPGNAAANTALLLAPALHQPSLQEREGRCECCEAACITVLWKGPVRQLQGDGEPQPSRRSGHHGQCCQGMENPFPQESHHTSSQDACVCSWRLLIGLNAHIAHWRGNSLKQEPAWDFACVQQEVRGVPVWSHSAP